VIRHPAATTTIAIEINRRSSSIDDVIITQPRGVFRARRRENKKSYERHRRRRRRQGHAFSTTVCDDDDDDDVDAPSSATASPTIGGRTRGDDSSRRMPDTNRHFYIDICHFILCNRMYTTYTTRAHC